MEYQQKIISLVQSRGPVLPVAVAKEIGTTILMASAMLAELVEKGMLKISKLKVGSSPLYFAKGQEQMLERFLNSMNEKDRRAVEELREKKVLRDSQLSPLTRVSLRNVGDFAMPLDVSFNNTKELFWKWQFIKDEEAAQLIKKAVSPLQQEQNKQVQNTKPELQQKQTTLQPETKIPEKKKEEKKPRVAKTTKDFSAELQKFFEKNRVTVIEKKCVKKNTEYDFILELPSPLGGLTYYCKAKSKKRVSDSDLAAAFVQGQAKKLPTLFLAPGDLTKKAKEMIGKEFKGMVIKKTE